MRRKISTACLLLASVAMPGIGQAMTTIDFNDLAVGEYLPGDMLFDDGTLQVSIAVGSSGNPRNGGTIINGIVNGGFQLNYLSSVTEDTTDNDGRVDLFFSIPIVGLVTLDASYVNTGANDFRVVDLDMDPVLVLHNETDGPNTKFISFMITTPTQTLRFRDSDVASVAIDNLSVTLVPIPAAVWLFGSALGLLGWIRRRTS
jgi:hypothetical protein